MDKLRKLEHLSLVSKVCAELNQQEPRLYLEQVQGRVCRLLHRESLLRIIQLSQGRHTGEAKAGLAEAREQLPCLAIPDKYVEMVKETEEDNKLGVPGEYGL